MPMRQLSTQSSNESAIIGNCLAFKYPYCLFGYRRLRHDKCETIQYATEKTDGLLYEKKLRKTNMTDMKQ